MEQLKQPELKWVSEDKNPKEEEEEEEEVVGLQGRRARNGHGQSGDINSSFDGNGTSSTVTSPGSGSSELKNRAGSGFQFTDEDEGFGALESHIEGHVDAGETELKNSNSVYFDRDQGTDSANGSSEIKSKVVESIPIQTNFGLGELNATSKDFSIQTNPVTEIEHQVGEFLQVKSFSDPSPLPLGKVLEEENTNVDNLNPDTGADEVVDLIEEECDLDVPDLDVEGVIAKQETHDLFCPNCHSCITKKVQLRRRKLIRRRKARIHKPAKEISPQLDLNPEHLEVEEDQSESRVDSGSNDGPTSVINGSDQNGDKDVFRCLSCFSFFIPEGNGLFRIFRGKNDTGAMQNPQDIPAPVANTNSFFSLFGSNKGKTSAVEQDTVIEGNQSLTSNNTPSGFVTEPPAVSLYDSTLDVSRQPTEAIKASQDGLNGEVPSAGESLLNGKSEIKVDQVTDMAMKYEILPDQNGLASYNQPVYRIEVENGGANGPQKVGIDTSSFSVQEYKQPKRIIAYVPEKLLDSVPPIKTGSTPTITVAARGFEPVAPEKAEGITGSREETSVQTDTLIDVGDPIVAEPSGGWDILKSIVYGGLIESITSLGVVSSAAGAGATTLNIMVLAVANLIGGFFIIAHSLGELKNDRSGETSSETSEPQGRHYEVLGRREKFKVHAVVVILSFLIFGALPPIIYGFSFRESDDREYKLAVVAASSLLCIALLASGKSHVQKPPKSYFKTVLYYVTIGFMASGVSYLVGVLLDKVAKDLGLFDSGSEQQLGWGSY